MTVIERVDARQILDCKARPMVEVQITTSDGIVRRGAAPTGQSVGMHEAKVLRDGDPTHYDGQSVHRAVRNVTEVIAPAVRHRQFETQKEFDAALIDLDGTPDKGRLGANAVYSASIAFLRAQAAEAGTTVYRHVASDRLRTIPVPTFNVVNGGRIGSVVQAFNEFLIVPHGARSVEEAVEMGVRVFRRLADRIEKYTGEPAKIAPSYGYAAPSADPAVVLSVIADAIDDADLTGRVSFALDCASSEMYDAETRTYEFNGARVGASDLVDYARTLTERFDLLFIEDLLDEDDWDGFSLAVRELPRTLVLGDDLIVTDRARLDRALRERAVDGFILKPNQVGTISEALDTYETARENDLIAIPSGRSGGVIDDIVMDLSVGLQVPFQKNGAPRSGERIEKLNFLLRAADDIEGSTLADLTSLARF